MPQPIREYRDLNLNFTAHPNTGDVVKITEEDAVKRSIRQLVLTNKHERFFRPNIGSSVTALLFENITHVTAIQIQRAVETVIQTYEPRAELESVVVKMNTDLNGFEVDITFFVVSLLEPIVMHLFLERTR